jgi:hypothetical protein
MGPNGRLIVNVIWNHTGGGSNTKTMRARWGGVSGTIAMSASPTTAIFTKSQGTIINRNAANSQILGALFVTSFGSSSTAGVYALAALNTATEQTLVFTGSTGLETSQQTTALVGAGGVCTATKATHGYSAGEYINVATGGNCPTSGTPNAANTVIITRPDANTITYACDCVGTEAGTQPTISRYSNITLESVDVELVKP